MPTQFIIELLPKYGTWTIATVALWMKVILLNYFYGTLLTIAWLYEIIIKN